MRGGRGRAIPGSAAIAVLALLTTGLTGVAPARAAVQTCGLSGTHTICVTVPDSPLSGLERVIVTNTPNSGQLDVYWKQGGSSTPLIRQFGPSPESGDYSFTWPTQKYLDGTGTLKVRVPGNSFVLAPNITLQNGNVSDIQHSPNDWQSYLPGPWTQPADPVVPAVGDGPSDEAVSNSVASMIAAASPPLFLFLGDIYDKGTYTENLNHYGVSALDDPSGATLWGVTARVTQPTAGNHEWPGHAADWTDYWHQRPPYTSFEFGGVLFVDLDTSEPAGVGSSQYAFVQGVLANAPPCVVAYGHIPPLKNTTINTSLQALWSLVATNGGDLWVAGHVHTMSEYVPLDANFQPGGHLVQLVAGSGGHRLAGTQSASVVAWSQGKTPGALFLTLNGAANGGTASSISWAFESTQGTVLRTGSVDCSA